MSIDPQEKAIRDETREFKYSSIFLETGVFVEFPTFDEVVEWKDGIPVLTKARAERLQREFDELDNAVQYKLVAKKDGWYPCLRCPQRVIFLKKDEVWRYGVTRKGERGRYSEEFLNENDLRFLSQVRGTLLACLKAEKEKIFLYPLLEENLARREGERLVKPPGNLRTD